MIGRRRKDIAEIATCRVRHIGISREANERRDNQRYDMSKVHIHLTLPIVVVCITIYFLYLMSC